MSEEILGIFPAWIRKGLVKVWLCKLFFTTERLIVAEDKRFYLTSGRLSAPEYIVSYASARDRLRMKQVSPKDVLKSNAENFDIPYADITVVEVKKPLSESSPIDFFVYVGDIDVPKHKFSVVIKHQFFNDFMGLIKTILPGKV